jgi:P-type E1-E2 ATPase
MFNGLDSLIGLGASCAFFYSAWAVLAGAGDVYFDTATMVLLLVTVGRLLEAHAHVRGQRAIADLLPGDPLHARAASLRPGDRVQVAAGERVPADGRILRGAASLDESPLTGEALPAARAENDTVLAGSLCLDGAIEIEVLCEASDFLLNRIVRAVEEARLARSPLENLADGASAVLVPGTILLAAATLAWWWPHGPGRAFLNALAVLVVACP